MEGQTQPGKDGRVGKCRVWIQKMKKHGEIKKRKDDEILV